MNYNGPRMNRAPGVVFLGLFFFMLTFFYRTGTFCQSPTPSDNRTGSDSPVVNSIGQTFVLIPAGAFMMGSPADEPGRGSDEVQHRVTISRPFYMLTTEVTQGQWRSVMGNNPSGFGDCGDDCPVENVSWEDVHAFIQRLNAREKTKKYRLPTEAEWEYAARSGGGAAFANGDIAELECGHDPNLDLLGWYCGNAGQKTHATGGKQSNAWGLYDVQGNVWEWCQDWYGLYPKGPSTDPAGPAEGTSRVYRGGSWDSKARHCRPAERLGAAPESRQNHVGFRLAANR